MHNSITIAERLGRGAEVLDVLSKRLEERQPVPISLLDDVVRFMRAADTRRASQPALSGMQNAVAGLRLAQPGMAKIFVRSAREYLARFRAQTLIDNVSTEELFQRLTHHYDQLLEHDHDRPALTDCRRSA